MSNPTAREASMRDLLLEIRSWGEVPVGLRQLAARIEAILALHQEDPQVPDTCSRCYGIEWPCETLRLLDGEGER